MALVVINRYVLNVFPLLICVPLHIDIYIPLCYQVHVLERVRYVG
jgi:hypothetical protein